MTVILIVLAGMAALVGFGYASGARRGQATREALLVKCADQRRHILELERTETHEIVRQELAAFRQSFKQHEQADRALHESVRGLLVPLIKREETAQRLAHLSHSAWETGSLAHLMNEIADKGGFSAVLLSDEVGLPVATSDEACDVDLIVGVSTLLLTLADRIATSGLLPPDAVVMRDGENQSILHRIFVVGGERYLLTAVTRGAVLAPNGLDPAIGALRSALSRAAVA